MPNLDPSQIRVAGSGALWKAPAGTPLPADSTTAWNPAFANLGYATDGFTLKQNLKTKPITGWQSLEPLRLINTDLDRSFSFENIESDKQNLSLAFGGATVNNTGVAVGGAVTTAVSGVITTATAHGFSVGDPVVFTGTVTGGLTAGTVYYVIAVGTPTTFTISATRGGLFFTTSVGAAGGVIAAAPYSIVIPDSALGVEFILGIDWNDGTTNQRFVVPRAQLLSLPTIKYTRQDAVRFASEIQALKPVDGSQSVLPYGSDWAASA
ncbi:hypothetical protein [Leifsonia sp. NPDC058248]|uniref:phage tail tube protein n=1 Tax=Leifsonia sp. NPDC058248 TaxID=3346402 RepID=UPI0036DF7DAB